MNCLLLGLLSAGTGAPGTAQGLVFGVSGARYEHVERVPFFGGVVVENDYVGQEAGAYLSGRITSEVVGLAMGLGTLQAESTAEEDFGAPITLVHDETLEYASLRLVAAVPRAGVELGGILVHVVTEDRSVEPAVRLDRDESWMAIPSALGWFGLGRGVSLWVSHGIAPLSAREARNQGVAGGASIRLPRSSFTLGVVGGDLVAFEADSRVGESWVVGVSTYVGATDWQNGPDFGGQIRVGWVFSFFGDPNQD